jgi:hypothetical protein
MEHNGQYWGRPVNDEDAILEIEQQRKNGATAIIFTWLSFWTLDYYKGMHEYLDAHYECTLNNERLKGYNLEAMLT